MAKWTHLMIHHTVTGARATVNDIRAMHKKRGFMDIGYHYLIARDLGGRGHLKVGRSDLKSGAHAGVVQWNRCAIGLSVIGNFHPGMRTSEHMSEALYQDVLGAVVHLCRKYHIPATNILGHRDVKSTACPGSDFPLARLQKDAAEQLAA